MKITYKIILLAALIVALLFSALLNIYLIINIPDKSPVNSTLNKVEQKNNDSEKQITEAACTSTFHWDVTMDDYSWHTLLGEIRDYVGQITGAIGQYKNVTEFLNSVDSYKIVAGELWHGDKIIEGNIVNKAKTSFEGTSVWKIFEHGNEVYIYLYNWRACGGCVSIDKLVIYNPKNDSFEIRKLDFDVHTAAISPDGTKIIDTTESKMYIYDVISQKNVFEYDIPQNGSVIAAECAEGGYLPDFKWINVDASNQTDAQIIIRDKNGEKTTKDSYEDCSFNNGKILKTILVDRKDIWR